jgi:hypothetical protein
LKALEQVLAEDYSGFRLLAWRQMLAAKTTLGSGWSGEGRNRGQLLLMRCAMLARPTKNKAAVLQRNGSPINPPELSKCAQAGQYPDIAKLLCWM